MTRTGFSIEIGFYGLEKPIAGLRRLQALGADVRPFMEDARGFLVSSVQERFKTGRGPNGIPWAPTKRQTRRAVGPDGPNKERILVDTEDLQNSIRGEVGRNYVEVGSANLKVPMKAIANQFGTGGSHSSGLVRAHYRIVTKVFGAPLEQPILERVRAHIRIIPARPFIGIDDKDVENIDAAWRERLIRTFTGAANGKR